MCRAGTLLLLCFDQRFHVRLCDSRHTRTGDIPAADALEDSTCGSLHPVAWSGVSIRIEPHIEQPLTKNSVCGAGVMQLVQFVRIGQGIATHYDDITCMSDEPSRPEHHS